MLLPYPFDAFQVPFQQAVQRKSDDVVHVLKLQEGETRIEVTVDNINPQDLDALSIYILND